MKTDCDIAIIGGGCAAWSLLRELIQCSGGLHPPTVHVFEASERVYDNKTWGFWHPAGQCPAVPVTASFAEWGFSAGDKTIRHISDDWRYSIVEGHRFFAEAVALANPLREITLRMGTPVMELRDEGEAVRVCMEEGEILARSVVDTRPPSRLEVEGSRLQQVFLGAEVRADRIPEGAGLGLMENMRRDEAGFTFDYIVPLGDGRVLVEPTRFIPTPVSRERLETDLELALERYFRGTPHAILRTEHGVIPMGLPIESRRHSPRIVVAGAAGGALRASSGYAFMDIQKWAMGCARSILAGQGPVGQSPRSRVLDWMDRLFLDVLRANPTGAPELFTRLAERVPVGTFVPFMTGEASPRAVWRVIRSLPAGPFLRQILFPSRKLPANNELFHS